MPSSSLAPYILPFVPASPLSPKNYLPLSDRSLNEGRGAMAFSRKPFTGTRPAAEGCMHIVPPVMMMSTRDSGYVSVALATALNPPMATGCAWVRKEREGMKKT